MTDDRKQFRGKPLATADEAVYWIPNNVDPRNLTPHLMPGSFYIYDPDTETPPADKRHPGLVYAP